MNLLKPIEPTASEREIARVYRARRAGLPGGGGMAGAREATYARLQDTGLQHRRIEAWHYTDLRRLLKLAPTPALTEPAQASLEQIMAAGGAAAFSAMNPARMVFVDGRLAPDLSDLEGLGEGVGVGVLSQGPVPEWAPGEIGGRRPGGDFYFQRYADGLACSAAYVAARRTLRPVWKTMADRRAGPQ